MNDNLYQIEFRRRICIATEVGRRKRKRTVLLNVPKGGQFLVRLVPYHKGQREVADLHFEDGSVAREISFAFFAFVQAGGAQEAG